MDMLRENAPTTAEGSVGPRCSRHLDGQTEVDLGHDVARFRAENSILTSVRAGTGRRSFRPVPTPPTGSAWAGTGRLCIMLASGSPGRHLRVVPRQVGTFLRPLEIARRTGEAFENQMKKTAFLYVPCPLHASQCPPAAIIIPGSLCRPPVRAGWEEKHRKAKDGHAGRALWLMWPRPFLGTALGQVRRAQHLDLPQRVAAATKGPQAVAVSAWLASRPG